MTLQYVWIRPVACARPHTHTAKDVLQRLNELFKDARIKRIVGRCEVVYRKEPRTCFSYMTSSVFRGNVPVARLRVRSLLSGSCNTKVYGLPLAVTTLILKLQFLSERGTTRYYFCKLHVPDYCSILTNSICMLRLIYRSSCLRFRQMLQNPDTQACHIPLYGCAAFWLDLAESEG